MKKLWIVFLCLILTSCGLPGREQESEAAPPSRDASAASAREPAADEPENYIRETAARIAADFPRPDAPDEERILAAYHYVIENTYFAEPVGLDIWRYRSGQTQPPTYVENRAVSPLVFGVGSCEDFAAALTVLLEAMGYEARYVAGYTLSVDGEYVDHAWTVVRAGGYWYHLDCQLEQNVIKEGRIRYRYFLKSDSQMIVDHKWGENLIAYWPDISREDADRIRRDYTPPLCEDSGVPPRQPRSIRLPERPDAERLYRQIEEEKAASGLDLPDIKLNTDPPELIHNRDSEWVQTLLYARSFLSAAEQAVYDGLRTAAESYEIGEKVPVSAGLSRESVENAVRGLSYDLPQYYWLEPVFLLDKESDIRWLEVRARKGLTAGDLRERQRELDEAAGELLSGVGGSGLEIVTAIHDRLILHIDYDRANEKPDAENIYGALVGGAAVCDGYAKAFQYLANRMGIDCVYIKGTSALGSSHAWNGVCLDGEWYYVDVTWDEPTEASGLAYHDYLNVTAAEMGRQHYRDTLQYPALPEGNGLRHNYYYANGYFIEAGRDGDSRDLLADAFARQLADRRPGPGPQPVYLEVKVYGDRAAYQRIKSDFIEGVFDIRDRMDILIRERHPDIRLENQGLVSCNFNDVMQILVFLPSASAVQEE